MPGIELLLSFAVTTAIFAYTPGPAMLFVMAQTLGGGRRGGLMAALGVHLGGYVHVLAATFGLSAIFLHVPLAYTIVKFAGAAYLVWLGIDLIRKRNQPLDMPKAGIRRRGSAFLQSISVEILNPKAAIFFVAFLPQFVDPSAGAPLWLQLLLLGTIVNIAFSSADVISVLLTSKILSHINVTQAGTRIARTIGGTILMGLGVRLAFDRN
jgi:threonine/homoserine/homoserine lactone efflux protein